MTRIAPFELCLVTGDVGLASAAERAGVERVLVDLETLGKAERQAGEGLFLSMHSLDDVRRLREVLRETTLMVRTNPIHAGTDAEVRAALDAGAEVLMLAMARSTADARRFVEAVEGKALVSILVENLDALDDLEEIVRVPGVSEVHVGLNDLRLSLGYVSLFEPLAAGFVDRAARVVHDAGLRFGFGGVTSPNAAGLAVPAERIIGEHVRLGSRLAWLGRSFRSLLVDGSAETGMRAEIEEIRACASAWTERSELELEANRMGLLRDIAVWPRTMAHV